MKLCKFCGKHLDDEANFCPYCMKKQITATVIMPPPAKNSHTALIITVCTLLIVLLTSSAITVSYIKSSKISTQTKNTSTTVRSSAVGVMSTEATTEHDYSSYIGKWVYSENGTRMLLNIISIKYDTMYFTLIRDSVFGFTAKVENMSAKIIDDVTEFKFENDSYGNAGNGKITFYDKSVSVETEIINSTETDKNIIWSIEGSGILFKYDNSSINLAGNVYLCSEFHLVNNDFGEYIKIEEDIDSGASIYYYIGYKIYVYDDIIKEFIIDFNDMKNNEAFNYKGINGKSTYSDVIRILGSPGGDDSRESVAYNIKNGYILIKFDDYENVIGFELYTGDDYGDND